MDSRRSAPPPSLLPMYVSVALAGVGFGASLPLLALLLEDRGVSGSLIGLNTAMNALAALVITPHVPRALARFGAAKLLILCMVTIGVTMVVMRLWVNVWFWFPVRFVFGAALATLFTAAEYWVSAAAAPERRGKAIGFYVMAFSAGWALGPFLLQGLGWRGWEPVLAMLGLLVLAIIPLAFNTRSAPMPEGSERASLHALFTVLPLATVGAFVFGGVELGIFALLPVYALRAGLTPEVGAAMLSAIGFGNFALQLPLGHLIDRVGVRPVLILCAAAGLAGAASLPFLLGSPLLLYPTLVLWGGLVTGLYTGALVILGERYSGAALAGANSAIVMAYALGGLLIPPISGQAMDQWRPHGLLLVLGLLCAGYLVLALKRDRPAP